MDDDDDPCPLGSARRRTMPGAWHHRSPEPGAGSPRGIRFSRLRAGGAGVTSRQVTPRNSTTRHVSERRYNGRYTFSPVYLRPRSACARPQRAQTSFVRFADQTQAQAGSVRNADQAPRIGAGRADVSQGGGAGFAGAGVAEPGRYSPKPGQHACRILLFDGFPRPAFRSFGQCNVLESMSYPRSMALCILQQDTFARRIQTIALLLHSCQKRRFMPRTREPQSRPPTQRRPRAPGQPVSTVNSGLPSAIFADRTQRARPPILVVWCPLLLVPRVDRPRIYSNQRRRAITSGKTITVPRVGDDYNCYKTETVITVIIIWAAACGVGLHASDAVLSYGDAAGARTPPGHTSRATGEAQS